MAISFPCLETRSNAPGTGERSKDAAGDPAWWGGSRWGNWISGSRQVHRAAHVALSSRSGLHLFRVFHPFVRSFFFEIHASRFLCPHSMPVPAGPVRYSTPFHSTLLHFKLRSSGNSDESIHSFFQARPPATVLLFICCYERRGGWFRSRTLPQSGGQALLATPHRRCRRRERPALDAEGPRGCSPEIRLQPPEMAALV